MANYEEQRAWAEQFMPEVKRIVGPLLLESAPFEIDVKEATDLIVMRAKDLRIGVRMRQEWVASHPEFMWQFTMRSRNGAGLTELQKVTNGFGDWLFYGFGNESDLSIPRWYVIDLSAWRAQMIRNKAVVRRGEVPNKGDNTWFAWYDVRTFTETVVLFSSHPVPLCQP